MSHGEHRSGFGDFDPNPPDMFFNVSVCEDQKLMFEKYQDHIYIINCSLIDFNY